MRIVEPKQFKRLGKPKRKRHLSILPLVIVVGLAVGLAYAWQHPPKLRRTAAPAPAIQPETEPQAQAGSKRQLKTFSGEDFKVLFRSLAHPNTQPFAEPPEITGNSAADTRIRTMAEKRGYKLTSIPVSALIKTGEATPQNDDLLQPLAYEGWTALKAAAHKDGIELSLYSAYRSPEFQRDLFLSRLYARGASASSIAAGSSDDAVEATLNQTAVPGYSRHHTGYTVDFLCSDTANFASSSCFRWLKENNYLHAKEYGWIPSYPEEAGEQGPEPEPWEYIWVGVDALSD